MRKTNSRILLSVGAIAVLVIPVLIWSGGDITKQNDVVTIGTEYRPQQMSLEEKETFSRRFMIESGIRFEPPLWDPTIQLADPGGVTPTLARSRNEPSGIGNAYDASADNKDPVSTIEIVPRAPGIEGMTPEERAKLEAYLKDRG